MAVMVWPQPSSPPLGYALHDRQGRLLETGEAFMALQRIRASQKEAWPSIRLQARLVN
jgi:hypothetical protein